MENASKALIIAGAILIAILLISLSLYLVNSGNGVLNQGKETGNTMESSATNTANSIKRNLGGKEINFTIDGTTYYATEGMTWEEWSNSQYNTSNGQIYYNEGAVVTRNDGRWLYYFIPETESPEYLQSYEIVYRGIL